MKSIIVVGCGARETMVLMKLIDSPEAVNYRFFTIGTYKNPFCRLRSNLIEVYDLSLETIQKLDIFLKPADIEFVFIGPEAPIVEGLTDFLHSIKVKCIAPTKSLSIIESSKSFTRELLIDIGLHKYNPKFRVIEKNDLDTLKTELNRDYKKVVKKDGLCSGKGVFVEDEHFFSSEEIIPHVDTYLESNKVVIEEKLEGLEFTLMSLVDTNGNLKHLPIVFDYKRLLDDDKGANTGSMGACILRSDLLSKYVPQKIIDDAQNVNYSVIQALNKKFGNQSEAGLPTNYCGIIYGSYMLCKNDTLKVIEFNCRLGDPEGVLALETIQNSLIGIFLSMSNGTLDRSFISLDDINLVGTYLVPISYPEKAKEKYDIYFINDMKMIYFNTLYKNLNVNSDLSIIPGNIETNNSHLHSLKSRSIVVLSRNRLFYKAYHNLYNNIDDIIGNFYYRKDIGRKFISKYEAAGVSIDNSNDSVSSISNLVKATYTDNVLGSHGDFGGSLKFNNSQLVSSIDGVGTKTHFLDKYFRSTDYQSLGEDIVNHNINDILVMGATPLFFLDYFGCHNLNKGKFFYFISGVSRALKQVGPVPVPLIGGETAEMPTTYFKNSTDIVGCIVGEKKADFIPFSLKPESGDILIGVGSDGPHTNGFSLINNYDWSNLFKSHFSEIEPGYTMSTFLHDLRKPHRCYLPFVEYFIELYGNDNIIKLCHITGGGLLENLNRVIPRKLKIILDYKMLDAMYPNWCKTIELLTKTSKSEMYRVFNCGVGFVVLVRPLVYKKIMKDRKLKVYKIGEIK